VPTPPSDAAFWFLRARRDQTTAPPVFVTDEIDTSTVGVGWFAPHSRTITDPVTGENDAVVSDAVVPVAAAGVLTASIASDTARPPFVTARR
jgi:hypothetical protein